MFNKGYNQSGADDILGSMVRTSPQNSFKKTISFNPSNLEDEEDPFLLPRPSLAKSNYSLPPQNFSSSTLSRRKPDDNKKIADDVDDLLTLIEGGKSDVSKKPPLPKAGGSPSRLDVGGSTGNRFYDEFNDDDNHNNDVVSSLYVPAARDRGSKPSYGSNDDFTKKRSNLFGIPADQSVTHSLKTTESMDQGYGTNLKLQRPQTSDPKATMMDSGIGEITLGVSRRGKSKTQAKDPNRPFTSPGILEKPDQFSEEKSMGTETPNVRRGGGGLNRGYFEEEDDGVSDYMSGIGNRDRADSKKSLLTAGTGFNAGIESEPGTRWDVGGKRDRLRVDQGMDATPKKSPGSEYGGRRDQDFLNSQTNLDDHRDYGGGNRGNMRRDYYDTASQLMSHASQPNSMNNFGPTTGLGGTTGGGARRSRGENRADGNAIRVEDDIAHLVRAQTGTSGIGGGSQNMLGTPMRDASIMIQEGAGLGGGGYVMHDTAVANKNFVRETEEFYKKRMKEAEEYYEKRFEDLKKALEEEKKKWEENYTKEIEQLKKEKEELRESSKVQVDRERDRLKEIFNLELESKDKVHKYEMERQKHLLEEQNEGLKRQLEAQTRLNALADEVRTSSNKLISLTDRLDKDNNKDGAGKKTELVDRERRVEELELRVKHEQTMWEAEKKRLEKLRTELDDRESDIQKMLDRERELLRGEYQRLTELQDSIKDQETDKRRKFESEKKAWENERVRLEEENKKLKVEFRDKYEQMEMQMEIFETQKHEFEEMIEKSEDALRQKHEEVDLTRKRLTIQEAETLRRMKALEHKEMIFRKDHEEVESKLNLLEIERLSLDKERMEMRGVAQKSRDDVEVLGKFKREWEVEKERNTKMKLEMDMLSRTIQQEREKMTQEKSTITNLRKTLEGIRFNYVKEFAATGPQPYISSSKLAADSLLAMGKENNGGEIYKQGAAMTINFGKERSRSPLRGDNRNRGSEPVKILTTLSDLKNKDTYGRSEVRRAPENSGFEDTSKLTTAKGFNYKSFMDQIKHYDKKTSTNQTYIEMEKEGLMKNKVDYGSGSLMRIKSLATSESSFKSSPKFKNSLAQYNTYDKMEDL